MAIQQLTLKSGARRRLILPGVVIAVAGVFALYAFETFFTFGPSSWINRLGASLIKGPTVLSETLRMRERGLMAYPFLQPDTYYTTGSMTGLELDSVRMVIPLSGIPRALTILCNESGTTIGYRADTLGFRNNDRVWTSGNSDIAIIGDSFAHGFCRTEQETVSGRLEARGLSPINAGITGAGPLAELGVLKEFIARVRPKAVAWMFYEGNDLVDIDSEEVTFLRKYLTHDYTENLAARRDSITPRMAEFADSLIAAHPLPTVKDRIKAFLILRRLRTATGLYYKPEVLDNSDESHELGILREVLGEARNETRSWGGELFLVYLPERRRFNKRTAPVAGEKHDPVKVQRNVKEIAHQLGIPFIDVATAFAKENDPAELWNSRRYHYNARGYEIVAREIAANLKQH